MDGGRKEVREKKDGERDGEMERKEKEEGTEEERGGGRYTVIIMKF